MPRGEQNRGLVEDGRMSGDSGRRDSRRGSEHAGISAEGIGELQALAELKYSEDELIEGIVLLFEST